MILVMCLWVSLWFNSQPAHALWFDRKKYVTINFHVQKPKDVQVDIQQDKLILWWVYDKIYKMFFFLSRTFYLCFWYNSVVLTCSCDNPALTAVKTTLMMSSTMSSTSTTKSKSM